MIGGGQAVVGAFSGIKSIQRGTIAGGSTATITSVDTANSILRYLGHSSNNDNQNLDGVRLSLTNATTVTANVDTAGGGVIVSYEVIEYYPGIIKSIQRSTMGANTTATITSVDVTKSQLDFLGVTTTSASSGDQGRCYLTLTNATTITSGSAGGLTVTAGYQVVEWY